MHSELKNNNFRQLNNFIPSISYLVQLQGNYLNGQHIHDISTLLFDIFVLIGEIGTF